MRNLWHVRICRLFFIVDDEDDAASLRFDMLEDRGLAQGGRRWLNRQYVPINGDTYSKPIQTQMNALMGEKEMKGGYGR